MRSPVRIAFRKLPFSCTTTSSACTSLLGLEPRAHTELVESIFSSTIEKSRLSGEIRVTNDPPPRSIATPEPWAA